jgi:hypothetical protein
MHVQQAPQRPTRRTAQVTLEAFEVMWKSIETWLKEGGHLVHLDIHRQSAQKILCGHASGGHDGYEIAKMFDDGDWMVDIDLANVLDNWGTLLVEAEQDSWEKWVKDNKIEPRFKVGDTVRCRVKFHGEIIEGCQIVEVDRKRGTYTVRHDDFGHVPLGSNKMGAKGFVLVYEQVEAELPA